MKANQLFILYDELFWLLRRWILLSMGYQLSKAGFNNTEAVSRKLGKIHLLHDKIKM